MSDLHSGKSNHQHTEENAEGWLVSYADMMTLLVGFFVILMSFSTINEAEFEKVKKETSKTFGGEYKLPYKELIQHLQAAIEETGLGDQVVLKESDAGVQISFRGEVFFDLGSAELNKNGIVVLENIIPAIMKESVNYRIVIEGHTDDIPIVTEKFKNNWELSSMRACKVLGMFEQLKFNRILLTAIGYADTRPLVKNKDANGNSIPENQKQNRRVVIKVMKQSEPILGAKVEQLQEAQTDKTQSSSLPVVEADVEN